MCPTLFKATKFDRLVEAVPELLELPKPDEDQWPCFLRGGRVGPDVFERAMEAALFAEIFNAYCRPSRIFCIKGTVV